ncbi:hypothetical protein R3P38DRAFT_3225199 [Favolaschia claudopus]|uniref:F-box domain-containing protein n=1 Tax=Favolaschia claudopus TaxID=2862362 RepID=A0AAV9ZVG6_9AGAR
MSATSTSDTSVNETASAEPSKFTSLPLDTVARIFLLALRPVRTQEQVYNNELLRDRLRRTCILFMGVVDSLPVMWSFIMLETANSSRPSPLDTSDLCAFVSQHLQKSAMCRLHIAFDLNVLLADETRPGASGMRYFHPSSDGGHSSSGPTVTAIRQVSVCRSSLVRTSWKTPLDLRIVDIATTKNVSCWKRHQRLKLASVDLHVVRCTVPVDVAFPPSSNLQYMHIASDRDQQRVNWSAFFSACTNLVHLKWDRRCALAPSPVVTLPSLLRLTLWDLRFLPPIFAPRLTELEVFDYSMPITVSLFVDLVGFAASLTS